MAEAVKTPNAKEVYEGLTGTQKCAILMMLIGEDEAAEIMGNLTPKEVQVLGAAMYSVQGLGQDTVNLVLDEFLAIIKSQTSLGISGGGYIKNVLTKSLGEDKAQTVLGKITPSDSNKAIEILDWLDARSIADLIIDEHPQIIALIISYLEPANASDVLNFMPEKNQADIIRRIATLETVQPEALKELDRVMQKVFSSNASLRASKVGGVPAEAKIMKEILKEDKKLMQDIQDSMFVFETLMLSDDKSLQTLLRAVEDDLIILALKGADEELRTKLFGCMSQRAAANIQDEMEALGPVRLTEVQEAQKQIIAVARRMSDEGTIVLAGRGGDDYV